MSSLLDFLKKTSSGAVWIYENEDRVYLSRFTDEQRKAYLYSEDFHMKSYATSGICLSFATECEKISVDTFIEPGSSRDFFCFDTYIDGVLCDCSGGSFDMRTGCDFTLEVSFGKGKKEVKIYFPQLACASVRDVRFDGVSVSDLSEEMYESIERPGKKVIFFGDSITQGYDSVHPSFDYVALVSKRLGYNFVNKGIGGDKHNAAVLFDDGICPDRIFVAYGTNDWFRLPSREIFADKIRAFYKRMREIYPQVPIFAISPVWRRDNDIERPTGDFFGIYRMICDICSEFENITVLDGTNFVGRTEDLFSDKRLHPNDNGFFIYAESLCRALEKY